MRDVLNCPNCGAPITATECPYCGTVFYDFTIMSFDRPTYIKAEVNDKQFIIARARITDLTATFKPDEVGRLDISMVLLPDDRGVYLERRAKTRC